MTMHPTHPTEPANELAVARWNAALEQMTSTEVCVAESWASARLSSQEAAEALRHIWPSHRMGMSDHTEQEVAAALRSLEDAWSRLSQLTGEVMGSEFLVDVIEGADQ